MTMEQLTYTAGKGCTMVCLVDAQMLSKYRQHEEGVTPAHVVDSFDIMKFESGKQGILSRPSKSELTSVFGTTNRDEAIELLLEKGEFHRKHDDGQTHRNKNKGSVKDPDHGEPHLFVPRSIRPL